MVRRERSALHSSLEGQGAQSSPSTVPPLQNPAVSELPGPSYVPQDVQFICFPFTGFVIAPIAGSAVDINSLLLTFLIGGLTVSSSLP